MGHNFQHLQFQNCLVRRMHLCVGAPAQTHIIAWKILMECIKPARRYSTSSEKGYLPVPLWTIIFQHGKYTRRTHHRWFCLCTTARLQLLVHSNRETKIHEINSPRAVASKYVCFCLRVSRRLPRHLLLLSIHIQVVHSVIGVKR